ncbi:MAG TPA: M23 family metallopeptidase [Candidatus Binatia bacterium]
MLLGGLAACSHGVYHRVRAGETLYRISKAYGLSVKRLAEANHLSDPSRLEVGQRLLIPHARRELPVSLITPRTANLHRPDGKHRPAGDVKFFWPVAGGAVTSGFGQRGHSFHDGIDISAPVGTPVHAAQDGDVIYSDVLRGYGNVIIVRHPHGFATVYAHNRSNQTHEHQHVRQGEVIGSVGDSGRTSGANLHFEVRQDNVAQDPLDFLPPAEQVAAPPRPNGRGS